MQPMTISVALSSHPFTCERSPRNLPLCEIKGTRSGRSAEAVMKPLSTGQNALALGWSLPEQTRPRPAPVNGHGEVMTRLSLGRRMEAEVLKCSRHCKHSSPKQKLVWNTLAKALRMDRLAPNVQGLETKTWNQMCTFALLEHAICSLIL